MDKKQGTVTFLYSALKEAQDNIRTYDTKAQIVGIGFIFTVGMILKSINLDFYQVNSLITSITWIIMLCPIVLFASVLYPTRKLAPSIIRNRKNVNALYYLNPNEVDSVDSFVKQIDTINIKNELAYELLKVSVLRDLKRRRFLRAMLYASLSFITLLTLQFVPVINGLTF